MIENIPQPEKREDLSDLDRILEYEAWARRPSLDEFVDIYGAEKINKDKERVKNIKQNFEDGGDTQKGAEALEVVVSHNIEQSEWFGPNVFSARASDFDDFVNNVDTVVEFLAEDGEATEKTVLAIDEFNGGDERELKKKITRAISRINSRDSEHKPQIVEYFASSANPKVKGRLENVVPLVIGMDGESSKQLFGKVAHLVRLEESVRKLRTKLREKDLPPEEESEDKKILELQTSKIKELKSKISHHWAQALFIEEILIQLEGYANLYQEGSIELQDDVIESINEIYNIFTELRDKKQEEGIDIPKSILDDEKSIIAKLENIFEEIKSTH